MAAAITITTMKAITDPTMVIVLPCSSKPPVFALR